MFAKKVQECQQSPVCCTTFPKYNTRLPELIFTLYTAFSSRFLMTLMIPSFVYGSSCHSKELKEGKRKRSRRCRSLLEREKVNSKAARLFTQMARASCRAIDPRPPLRQVLGFADVTYPTYPDGSASAQRLPIRGLPISGSAACFLRHQNALTHASFEQPSAAP